MALASLIFLASGCAPSEPSDVALLAGTEVEIVVHTEWESQFEDAGVVGTFVLHRLESDVVDVGGSNRWSERFTPASTFKIINSLIALDTGVISTVDEIVTWDGVERDVDVWNQDQSLRTAIEFSAVWVYQDLARRVGSERMQRLVSEVDYGNSDIGGPIDSFWLRGDLRISAIEQVDVLARLMVDGLPFDPADQASVREILVREAGPDWVWGHKTGTALAEEPVIGWLVGFTEFDGASWVFALNVDLPVDPDLAAQINPEYRVSIAREILASAGALPRHQRAR